MNQQIRSQQHHMTTSTSGGGTQVMNQTYEVQQQQQTFQQHYTGQQPVRMQQQYQVHQQQSSHQGGFGQPGQTQRIVQDTSSMNTQQFVTKGQQPFQRIPQQPQTQNQTFMNQSPVNQQTFQPNNFQNFPNQQKQFSPQQNSNLPQNQGEEQMSQNQYEEDFLKKPTKKLHNWPPQQIVEDIPKHQFEPGSQVPKASWPPQTDYQDTNQAQFEPNPLGDHNFGMPSKPDQSLPPMKNVQQPSHQQYAPQSNEQNQFVPQQYLANSQKPLVAGPQKGLASSPKMGGVGQGVGSPASHSNIPQKSGFDQRSGTTPVRGFGQLPNANQNPGLGQGSNIPQGKVTSQVPHSPQGSGLGQGSFLPQGIGYNPLANKLQTERSNQGSNYQQGGYKSDPQNSPGLGNKQSPNNPQAAPNGLGSKRLQGTVPSQDKSPIVGTQGSASQPQVNPEGVQKNEPLSLPRGNINDQKSYFEKPHSYDPSQCEVGRPYGDGSLPEWPPKNAGGPNMTMTYPSAFKLRDEAPIDHQTLPVSAPSQPAFKVTTPIRKCGDEMWPPKGAFGDEPTDEVREFSKPTKTNKGYDAFFAANMMPNNYPGYRAPPGTQHVGYMDDAQPL